MLRAALLLALFAVPASAAPPTAEHLAKGWVMLFDGETTFGWTIDGDAKVEGGKLILGGTKATTARTTTEFGTCDVELDYEPAEGAKVGTSQGMVELPVIGEGTHTGKLFVEASPRGGSHSVGLKAQRGEKVVKAKDVENATPIRRSPVILQVPAGKRFVVSRFWFHPEDEKPLFNGKDLTGWKEFPDRKSKFTVTKEGWLNVKDGPGDLATVDQFADFVLQLECISNGDALNSGIFFRCIPDQYQQGYEAQIRNQFVGGDRTKPFDFGTGAIYRRQAARKVVPNDREWFTMTVVAHGNHIATWVNGYQTADFTDDRPETDNARKGTKLGKGTISIQGHDPTTDLSFRNIRVAELPPAK